MDFWRLIELLNQRKWLILVSVGVTMVLTYGATRLAGSQWVATARLMSVSGGMIFGRNPEDVSIGEGPQQSDPGGLIAKSQAAAYEAVVKSSNVVTAALDTLKKNNKGKLPALPRDLMKNIKVVPAGARLFDLTVSDRMPKRAEAVVNALAKAFVKESGDVHAAQLKKSITLLDAQLAAADARLSVTRRRYDAYRREHGIMGEFREQMGRDLTHLDTLRQHREERAERLTDLEARLRTRQVELEQTPQTMVVHHPLVLSNGMVVEGAPGVNPRVHDLQQQLAQAEQDLSKLQKEYTEESPRVKDALARRNSIQSDLDAARAEPPASGTAAAPTKRASGGQTLVDQGSTEPNPAFQTQRLAVAELKQEISGATAELAALDTSLANRQVEAQRYQGVDGPLAAIMNDITQQSEARSLLAGRLQVAQMAKDAAAKVQPLTILDLSGKLNQPVNSTEGRTQKILLIGALCALIGTAGLVVAFDSVDRRLRSVKQADLALPAPVRAAIPQPLGGVTAAMLPRVTETQPLSLHAEAYRSLGFHLLSSRAHSVMVSSANANQGCTNTVANLAITLAQAGHRVIVVDANVRAPRVHEVFEISNDFGFTSLLESEASASLQEALHHTALPNLWVIPSGPVPKNVWGLFKSNRLVEVTGRLREFADYVIYDTPSALAFTDALNLAPVVEAAYVCVRALQPSTGVERRLIDALNEAGVMVLGSVLTDVPASVLETYSTFQRYYPNTAAALPRAATVAGGVPRPAPASSWIDDQDNETHENSL